MMTLAQASAYFDRTPALDPDSGLVLFYGQVDPFDDSKRDAGSAYRRILSVAPGTEIPTHRTVRIFEQVWVLGAQERDGLAELHRDKYVMQGAEQWSIQTLDQWLSGTAGDTRWGGVEWSRDTKEIDNSSDILPVFNGLFAAGAPVAVNKVLSRAGEVHLVRAVRPMPSGLLGLVLARLDGVSAPVTATVTSNTYDPVAGVYVGGSIATVPSLLLRWQNQFEYTSQAQSRFRPGDDVLMLPTGTTVNTSSQVEQGGVVWRVLGVDDVSGVLAVHVRRS